MSMMELLSQMRERARAKKQRKGRLPWFCIILSDKCVEPEKPCTECRVYEEHKEEIEKEMDVVEYNCRRYADAEDDELPEKIRAEPPNRVIFITRIEKRGK